MKILIFLTALVLAFLNIKSVENVTPTESYANHYILVQPDIYHVFWNSNDTDITFEVHVKQTYGWIGFGISRNGGMHNSDVIIAIFGASGYRNFTDRHILNDANVAIDQKQDWFPLFMGQNNSYSIVKFTRKIVICNKTNEDEDLDIIEGTPFVIFAWGNSLTSNNEIQYHGTNKSSTVLPLINSLRESVQLNMSEITTYDFLANLTLYGTYNTEYYCQVFKLPTSILNVKKHVIRIETILNNSVSNDLLHHWNIYECDSDFENIYLKNHTSPPPSISEDLDPSLPFNRQWNDVFKYCSKISWVWAKGGNMNLDFPSDLAYPIGGPDADFKYFVMETHYNNPTLIKSFRIYTTENYRKNEFGIFTVGGYFSWNGVLVPPNVPNFNIDIYCRHDCVDKLQESPENINNQVTVFGSMFHAHLTGREGYSKLIRNGKEISYLYKNQRYDPYYQYYSFFQNRTILKKGDDIKVSCNYSTSNTNFFVKGGVTATDEMCQVFLMYYPRNPKINRCKEIFELDTWKEFLISLDKRGVLTFLNETLNMDEIPQSILKANVTNELVRLFQEFESNALRTQICIDRNGISQAEFVKGLPPLKTIQIQESAKCTNNEKKPVSGLINFIWDLIKNIFRKLFRF